MKILLVNPVGQIGGAERVMLDCIWSIQRAESGHEIHVLLMDDGPLAEEARKLGARVSVLPAPSAIRTLGDSALKGGGPLTKFQMLCRIMIASPKMWGYARRMRRGVREIAPDVIHSNGLKSHLMLSAAKLRQPVIWHIHDFVGARPMMTRLSRRFSCDAAPIAISNAVAEDIRTWLPGSAPVVVMNGIDIDRFSPKPGDGAKLDELSGLAAAEEGTVRIGLVATYARWKGQDLFLRAAKQVLQDARKTPVRFYIIGGRIYTTQGSQFSRDELQSLVSSLGIAQHVGWIPFQSDPVSIYRSLDVVVHASTQPEPFGLTVAEAMACGRPLIVSASGGVRELFREGIDALGVPPGHPDDLAKAMLQLIESPALGAGLGQAARLTAKLRFDRTRLGPELLSIYRTQLKSP